MILPDVNLLIYAHRKDSAEHVLYRDWLTAAVENDEPLGLCDPVIVGFIRIVTNPRVYREPTPPAIAVAVCEVLLEHPSVTQISPGARCWKIFSQLMDQTRSRGNDVPDAWLAAMAMERDATWVSEDADFGRYPGLRWTRPHLARRS